MKILVADDEPKIRRGLSNYIGKLDYLPISTIEQASNGVEALEKIRTFQPDIVLLDICMPKMNGLELVEALSLEVTQPLIIIISGHNDFAYAQTALRYGVYDYILKPLRLEEFEQVLSRGVFFLQDTRAKHHDQTVLEQHFENSRDYLNDSFFRKVIRGLLQERAILGQIQALQIPVPIHGCLMVAQVAQCEEHPALEDDLYDYAMHNVLGELSKSLAQGTIFVNGDHHCAILFSHRGEDLEEFSRTIVEAISLVTPSVVTCHWVELEEITQLKTAYESCIHRDNAPISTAVKDAVAYLKEHCGEEELSLQDVAQAIGFHPTYLSKRMRDQLGIGFSQYLTDLRMQKAVKILSNPEHGQKLYEVAELCGFRSQHYFCRVFRKYYGVPPTQYKGTTSVEAKQWEGL